MADPNLEKFDEIYRLVKENNRMLHKLRRNAFLGGIVRLIIWAALLGVPVWLFFTYFFPVLQSMMETFEQFQGAGAATQVQFGNFQDSLREFQSNIPFLPQGE